jgi:peptide/nickel transport system substrate-binding protein
VLVAATAALSACGGDDSSGGGTPSAAGSASAASSTKGKVPERTFVDVMSDVPETFDPAMGIYAPNVNVVPNFMATLVARKGAAVGAPRLPAGDDVAPYLAESWKKDAKGDVVFTLRKGVKSAAGNELTSDDVVYTFQRLAAVDFVGLAQLLSGNVDVKKPITKLSKYRFRLNVYAPSANTVGVLSWFATGIVDKKLLSEHATAKDPFAKKYFTTHSASFGAYSVADFQPGAQLTLKANPGFWKKPYFDQVVIKAVPDASSRLQLVLSGQASHTLGLSWSQFKSAQEQGKAANVSAQALGSGAVQWLLPFESVKEFRDPRVRQAVNLALDRDALKNAILLGNGAAPGTQIVDTIPTTFENPPVKRDLEKAKALLKEAGYPNGFEFTLSATPSGTGAYISDEVSLIQQQLAEVGIEVKPNIVASASQFAAMTNREAVLNQYNPDPAEAGSFLLTEWSLKNKFSPGTQVGYKDPEFQKWLTSMAVLPAGDERNALIEKLYRKATEDQPGIAVLQPPTQNITDASITGYQQYSYPITFYEHLGRGAAAGTR